MSWMIRSAAAAVLVLLVCATEAPAQWRPAVQLRAAADDARAWAPRPLGVAKWTTLGGGLALATLGFLASGDADSHFEELDRRCGGATPCERTPAGGYADPELERLQHDARAADQRARQLLLGAQIGIAASAALFILDLSSGSPPPNIPHEPSGFQLGRSADGGVTVRLRVLAF